MNDRMTQLFLEMEIGKQEDLSDEEKQRLIADLPNIGGDEVNMQLMEMQIAMESGPPAFREYGGAGFRRQRARRTRKNSGDRGNGRDANGFGPTLYCAAGAKRSALHDGFKQPLDVARQPIVRQNRGTGR